MITLYDDQDKIVSAVHKAMSDGHKHIMIQDPTGAGKTVIFSFMVSEMKRHNKRALIVTDRVELLFETGGTLEEFGLIPFHVLPGQMVEPMLTHQVYVAMSQTIRRRFDKWSRFWNAFDVVIFDEAHKQEFNPYFEKEIFRNDPYILGFSATPVRSGNQRQLYLDYAKLIEGPQVCELIAKKRLVKDRYFGSKMDMSGVGFNSRGDYKEGEMFSKFNKTELYSGVVENWQEHTPDTITLCFCVNIQHVIKTCKEFNRNGITAKFLVSPVAKPKLQASPTAGQIVRYDQKVEEYNIYVEAFKLYSGDRKTILSRWRHNEFKVLINAGILTTGFNRKDIETIIMDRATVSLPLWLQIIGRGSRTFPGKNHFNILDFGGNGHRLGFYNQMRKWNLTHEKKSVDGGVMPVKPCGSADPYTGEGGNPDINGNCGCGALIFTGLQICPACGYIFEHKKAEKFADLIEIDYISEIETKKDFINELEKEAEAKGYKFGWIINRIIAEDGENGLKEYAKRKGYKSTWFWQTRNRYKKQIDIFNEKNKQDEGDF